MAVERRLDPRPRVTSIRRFKQPEVFFRNIQPEISIEFFWIGIYLLKNREKKLKKKIRCPE
jgi:hypothetical protein